MSLVSQPVVGCIIAFGPALWLLGAPQALTKRSHLIFPICVGLFSSTWHSAVSSHVKEPYLDEIFHIPQAQQYCRGAFEQWDDKITTPPGLYLASLPIQMLLRLASPTAETWCDATTLRLVNVLQLCGLSFLALICRQKVENVLSGPQGSSKSTYAMHTAFNIAMFPLLFFFSGLYYTDVLSTVSVLAAYAHHLGRVSAGRNSITSDLGVVLAGVVALTMRQTNVFWVVVYMGGLEAVHAIKKRMPKDVEAVEIEDWADVKNTVVSAWDGELHDPRMKVAWPDDMALCGLTLVIAVLRSPLQVMRSVWPYIAVLGLFGTFVFVNGGVVLGDKENHVATIHLPQMLYIWPLFAFFSLPLFLSYAVEVLDWAVTVLFSDSTSSGAPNEGPPARNTRSHGVAHPQVMESPEEESSPKPTWRWLLYGVYLLATIVLSGAIVHFNTIIHPFTLADNRHYMFYVFRYTILRDVRFKYLLILPYTLCRWAVWRTLAGHGEPKPQRQPSTPKKQSARIVKRVSQLESSRELQAAPTLPSSPASSAAVPISTALIFVVATSLSLITAPLVEPRYFIIPWVIWRLNVPEWRPSSTTSKLIPRFLMGLCSRYDVRLIGETLWFLAINLFTGYLFLERPFQWKAADGEVLDDGRLQRFMW